MRGMAWVQDDLHDLLTYRRPAIAKMVGEPSMAADKRKLSLYFPADMIDEMEAEAQRLDRPMGWLIQVVWKIARKEIQAERLAHECQRSGGDDADD